MPPSRRPSVGVDAAASPRDASPAGSAASRSRGGRGPAPRAARGGRARGRGRGASSSSGSSSASASARAAAGGGRDPGSEGDADDDAGYSRSPSSSAGGLARALSPELGVPPVAPAFQRPALGLPRSSSLSLLSDDRSPSPATPAPARRSSLAPDGLEPAADDADDTFVASPLSTGTARAADTPARPSGAAKASSRAHRDGSSRALDDSLSELDSSDDDRRGAATARAQSSDDEPLASTSTLLPSADRAASASRAPSESQTPAPTLTAPKRRGRPPGSKNKQPKVPGARAQRAAVKADPPYRAPSGSEGTASPGAASARQRATRANVTLPPGYIEGVTSSRWPRAGSRKKRAEDDEDEDEDEDEREGEGDEPVGEAKGEDVTGTTTPVESRASSVNGLINGLSDAAAAAAAGDAAEVEEIKPTLLVPVDRKGKGRAVDGEDDDDVSTNGGEGTLGVSAPMSRETSVDERSVTPAVAATPTKGGKGKAKGKRSKKAQAAPEPVERGASSLSSSSLPCSSRA